MSATGHDTRAAMKTASSPWLIGPWADSILFIATPLLIIPTWHVLSLVVSLAVLKFVVLAVSATGHHLPGFIRAYTDPVVFRRFRARLVVVPLLIIALVAVTVYFRLSLVFLLLVAWGTWHGIMQVHGFSRIYDGKAGIQSRLIARLDLWVCLAWFIQVILWSTGKKMSLLGTYYMAGGPLLPAPTVRALETAWFVFTLGVTAAYAMVMLRGGRALFNPRKVTALVVSILFWAYCMITIDNLIVGLLLWEIFHDLQYNAFVWSYNQGRVERGLARSRIENFLFRKGWGRVALYTLCIVAYGCIGFLSQDTLNLYQNRGVYGNLFSQIGMVFAASALIHFYMDGFIWKVRDPSVRADLGMAATAPAPPPARRGEVRHWAFIVMLFSASVALATSEYAHGKNKNLPGVPANLIALIPGSGYAHFLRAAELVGEGNLEAARTHYETAIALDTNFAFLHPLVANLDLGLGDTAAAIASYEKAWRLDARDTAVNARLAELYLATRRYPQAEAAYRSLARLVPDAAEAHYGLAFSLLQQRRGLDAKPHLERSLALDSAQPAALNYLGMVEHATGNRERARRLYDAALRLDPGYAHARENRAQL